MKRTAVVVGLSLVLAAPVALAAPPGTTGTTTGPAAPAVSKPETKPVAPQAKGKLLIVVRACVTEDATAKAVKARVLSSNAHARRAQLKRGVDFTADIEGTKIALVGKGRVPGTSGKASRVGGWDNLDKGDVVTMRIRVGRTSPLTQWGAFGSWAGVVDNGPIRKKVCPPNGA
jgi:hypothetical protein